MESIIRDVTALEQAQRDSLEALLGHQLQDNQRLYIAVLPESGEKAADSRQQARDQLNRLAAKADANLQAGGISSERWAAMVDEECEAVRHGTKP